jgi:hypothetical protein
MEASSDPPINDGSLENAPHGMDHRIDVDVSNAFWTRTFETSVISTDYSL